MQSPRLQFCSNGQYLAVADPEGVTVVPFAPGARGGTQRLVLRDVAAVASFPDQIWALDGERRRVHRWSTDGRPIGAPRELSAAPCADWWVAPTGAPAVLLEGTRRVALVDDLGSLEEDPVDGKGIAIPVSGRRYINCDGRMIRLGNGAMCRLGEGVRVLAGAALFDGAAVALIVERTSSPETGVIERSAVLLSIASARLQQRVALPAGELRIAARRGVAIVQTGPRELVVIDLRFGRTTNQFESPTDIDDFAVDPDALRVAVRSGVALQIHVVRDWHRASSAPEVVVDLNLAPVAAEAETVVDVTDAPDGPEPPATAAGEVLELAPLPRPMVFPSLGAVRPLAPTPRDQAARLLDRELRTVGLWALVAVARGWDSRRIGYPNEGAHPYEMEVAAILGMNEGHARDYLAAAHERLADHELGLAGDPERRARTTPVGALAAELGLSTLAIDILLVIAAPALWGDVARVYGVLANDPNRALVDELLVQYVLGDERASRYDITRELDPSQPLVRFGLVHLGSRARPFASLTVDPIVLARLRGDAVDLGTGSATQVRHADRSLDDVLVPRDLMLTAIRYLSRDPGRDRHARIALRGRVGSGRRTLLAALAAEVGRDVAVIDMTRLPRKAGEVVGLRSERRRALLRGLVPCITRLDEVTFEEQGAREQLAATLRGHPGPIVIRLPPGAAVPFDPGHLAIDLPTPSEGERLAVWETSLPARGLVVRDVAALAARYRVGPGTIHGVVDGVASARADEGRASDDDATEEIDVRMRQTREVMLGEHATRVERLATWSSVVLPPDVLDSLRELIGRVRHRRTVFERWGFDRTMATSRGLTALFQGAPGTGKTLVAGIVARELGLDLYQVDLSKVMSKWLGETERNLAAIFDAAEDGQVVLLFDEADSLFAKRTEVRSSNDRYANLEVNYLLQRLDAFAGIAILTTNFGGSIDPAFKRRLSFRLSFPFPDEETREQLWRVHLPAEMPVEGPLDLASIAKKYQLAGGYIRNACLRAAFLAAQAESPLTQHHLERAVALEFAELGKLSTTGSVE